MDRKMESTARIHNEVLREVVASPVQPPLPKPNGTAAELQQILSDLIALAGGKVSSAEQLGLPQLSESGEELKQTFRVGLPIGAARLRVDAFRQQHQGELLGEDEQSYEMLVVVPTNFWRQWLGRQPGFHIKVELARLHAMSATPIGVTVTVTVVGCGQTKAILLLKELGIDWLESLRTFLLVNSERRTHDRLLWPHPVEVCPIEEDGSVGQEIVCRGKDISLGGIAFYLPHALPTSQVLIRLSSASNSKPLLVPATVVRARRCADGWYDVGAIFRLTALRHSNPEIFAACTA
jgi:hypothetical protein